MHGSIDKEINSLHTEIVKLRDEQARLATLFALYMEEASLDRPERISRAREKARLAFTIIGGVEAEPGEFRDCCAVGQRDNGFFGSGALIAPRVVITAAHVGPKGGNPPQDVAYFPLKTSNRLDGGPTFGGMFREHPGFVMGQNQELTPHDLAVLILSEPGNDEPVPIASTEDLEAAASVTLAGYGRSGSDPASSGIKRFAEVPLRFVKKNGAVLPEAFRSFTDPDSEFVAGFAGHGGCKLDSGGPAYVMTADGFKLAGVISRGPGSPCPSVTVVTRLDVHADWINQQIAAAQG